jgi:hypothetical protein
MECIADPGMVYLMSFNAKRRQLLLHISDEELRVNSSVFCQNKKLLRHASQSFRVDGEKYDPVKGELHG